MLEGTLWIMFLFKFTLVKSQGPVDPPGCLKTNCSVEYDQASWTSNPFSVTNATARIASLVPTLETNLAYDCHKLKINHTDVQLITGESYIKFGATLTIFSTDPSSTVSSIHTCVSSSTFMDACFIMPHQCVSDIDEYSASKFNAAHFTKLPCCSEDGCPVDDCSPNPCKNGAVCTDVGSDFICTCTSGWSGKICDQKAAGDPCNPNPCKNGAVCTNTGSDFICACTSGWSGKFCDKKSGDGCSSGPCKNGGTCVKVGDDDFKCTCAGDWLGTVCNESKPHGAFIAPEALSVMEGDNATFHFLVSGYPEPVVTWYLIGQSRRKAAGLKRHWVHGRKLVIFPVIEQDAGSVYEGVCFNKHGADKASARLEKVFVKNVCAKNPCPSGQYCMVLEDSGYSCSFPVIGNAKPNTTADSNGPLYLIVGLLICIVVVLLAVILGRYIYSRRITPRVIGTPDPRTEAVVTFTRRNPNAGGDQVDAHNDNQHPYTQLVRPQDPPPYSTVDDNPSRLYAELRDYQEVGPPPPLPPLHVHQQNPRYMNLEHNYDPVQHPSMVVDVGNHK